MPIFNPEFDPDWQESFRRAKSKVDATRSADDLPAMHNAFWSQFRTMAEIRDFHINSLMRKAEAFGFELNLPHVDDDCTWEEIIALNSYVDDAINDRIAYGNRPPRSHPEGLAAFLVDDGIGQRFTEYYEYDGFWDIPSACYLTIEYQEEEAYVCFTLLQIAGTSPVNMIETLATTVYRDHLADRYDPENIHWYAYVRLGRSSRNEHCMQAVLTWDRRRKEYTSAHWMHFGSAPPTIARIAELDDDAEQEPIVRPRRIPEPGEQS